MSRSYEEAASELTDFFHSYIDIADAKDIEAVEEHLANVDVHFPHANARDSGTLRKLFSGLWSDPRPHRHDTTNVVVRRSGNNWTLDAHYVRWIFSDAEPPRVVTLGAYQLSANENLSPISLTVTRWWSES